MYEKCLLLKNGCHHRSVRSFSLDQEGMGENRLKDILRKKRVRNKRDGSFAHEVGTIDVIDLEAASLPMKWPERKD